jgi:hypothetical protein
MLPTEIVRGFMMRSGAAIFLPCSHCSMMIFPWTEAEGLPYFPALAELTGVRPMIETYPLEKAGEAYARMMSGNAEFRVDLTM